MAPRSIKLVGAAAPVLAVLGVASYAVIGSAWLAASCFIGAAVVEGVLGFLLVTDANQLATRAGRGDFFPGMFFVVGLLGNSNSTRTVRTQSRLTGIYCLAVAVLLVTLAIAVVR